MLWGTEFLSGMGSPKEAMHVIFMLHVPSKFRSDVSLPFISVHSVFPLQLVRFENEFCSRSAQNGLKYNEEKVAGSTVKVWTLYET